MEKIFLNLKKNFGSLDNFFNRIGYNLLIRMFCYVKKIGGKKVLIPHILKSKDSIPYSVKLIIKSIKGRSEKNLKNRLENELIDVYNNTGLSIKKKIDMYNIIESNYTNIRFAKKKKK